MHNPPRRRIGCYEVMSVVCLFSELRNKEVIDLKSGARLGYVCDAEFDSSCGTICALIVPGAGRAGGLRGRDDDYVIPWNCISRLGDDIILVELPEAPNRRRRDKRPLLY